MAGNYPDTPSWRMAYDRDGTQVYHVIGGSVTQLADTTVAALNNEAESNAWGSPQVTGVHWITFLFPEKRDIDGFFGTYGRYHSGYSSFYRAETSSDSTNGLDGTWTQLTGSALEALVVPNYRTSIQSSTALGVTGFRIGINAASSNSLGTHSWRSIHLYGERAPGPTLKRLELWHPTLDQRIDPNHFDWGNAARASTDSVQFRVKNLSDTYTATDVRVAMEALTDAAPSVVGQHALSVDGASWLAQVNVGSIAPGQASQLVTLRRELQDTAVLGVWAMRVFAEQATWV